jgi:hypothetical protein
MCPSKNNTVAQVNKMLSNISLFYGANPSVGTALEICSVRGEKRKKWKEEKGGE